MNERKKCHRNGKKKKEKCVKRTNKRAMSSSNKQNRCNRVWHWWQSQRIQNINKLKCMKERMNTQHFLPEHISIKQHARRYGLFVSAWAWKRILWKMYNGFTFTAVEYAFRHLHYQILTEFSFSLNFQIEQNAIHWISWIQKQQ